MADLTGKTIANGYPNLVTIGATTNDNPTSGTLENGKGNNLTSVTFDGAVVVNESGGNNDFRVEGDTDANLLFVDASTDRVGIGTNAPANILHIKGALDGGVIRTALFENSATSINSKSEIMLVSGGNTTRGVSIANLNESTSGQPASMIFSTSSAFSTPTERMRIDSSGNVLIGTTATPTSSAGNIVLKNGTAPTGNATDGVILYAEDVSTSSELKVRDEAGNVTTLSPHNFSLIPNGASEPMAWAYYSERDGKKINVDMLKLARMVESLTGEKLVYEQ